MSLSWLRAITTTSHDKKPANPTTHKTPPVPPYFLVATCPWLAIGLAVLFEQPGHTNTNRNPHKGKRAPWSTPLVSAFVNLVVVGGCWGVVLVVCFWCVLGGFLFCFCFVFCLFLFSFCVGGGGIVRFI